MDAESVLPSEWKPVEIGGGLILTAAVALRLAGVAPFSAAATGMTLLSDGDAAITAGDAIAAAEPTLGFFFVRTFHFCLIIQNV